ncbi:MAG: universal stress protein [Acetobacteraceae bacterium]|nr:universal stress protein [Acetobacteraceae bacterium]
MALKDLLVHLDGSEQSNTRLGVACRLAKEHGAHLTGLHVTEPLPVVALAGAGLGESMDFGRLISVERDRTRGTAQRIEAKFLEQIRGDGVDGKLETVEGLVGDTVTRYARYADLAIVGQHDPDQSAPVTGKEVAQQVMLASGVPALIIPRVGEFEKLGQSILIAWNATRESARALHDAMPLLERARVVTVLTANPRGGISQQGETPAADVVQHLARHGIKATAVDTIGSEASVGDVLLNNAADAGADLLVMGGYGHSRVREIALGGATRTLLREMTLPVLMSH